MSIGIITCSYGNYDTLHPLPEGHGFEEAVCVTDDKTLEVEGWKMVYFPPVHSNLSVAAKFPRCFPELFLSTDSSVWIDASFRIETTFKEWTEQHLEKGEIVLLKHPEGRTCAFEEADHGKRRMWKSKYRDYPLDEQVEQYKKEGMPPRLGLWAVGYMARHHTPSTYELCLRWWKEIEKWGALCQVSLPYAIWINERDWLLGLGKRLNIAEWEVFKGGEVYEQASDGITPLIKHHPHLENYQHVQELEEDSQVNSDLRLSVIICDNFYDNPDSIRELALNSEFIEDLRYHKGKRSAQNYRPVDVKRKIESLLGKTILDWEEQGHNGKFQYCVAEDPIVYHWDTQKMAAVVFLNPEAPYEGGTSLFAENETGRKHKDETWMPDPFTGGFYDKTKFQVVDQIGNIYNRMVIFDAGCIHAATEYFGTTVSNSRLFQMFFFNTES